MWQQEHDPVELEESLTPCPIVEVHCGRLALLPTHCFVGSLLLIVRLAHIIMMLYCVLIRQVTSMTTHRRRGNAQELPQCPRQYNISWFFVFIHSLQDWLWHIYSMRWNSSEVQLRASEASELLSIINIWTCNSFGSIRKTFLIHPIVICANHIMCKWAMLRIQFHIMCSKSTKGRTDRKVNNFKRILRPWWWL